MQTEISNAYEIVRETGAGFFENKRGLIEVSGAEAEMFLNGLITNDVKKQSTDSSMFAAFPNAQGRLLALVRVLKFDSKFVFDTEAATFEKVLQNLSRFTLAGDFKVNDLTGDFSVFSVRGNDFSTFPFQAPVGNEIIEIEFESEKILLVSACRANGFDAFVPNEKAESFKRKLEKSNIVSIDEKTREILRVENGEPLYNIDVDETTVVLETGLDEAVSFNKGCYIGQEIIARIHFRGHVAKKLTGLIFEDENARIKSHDELKSIEGKNAGRITSITFSPRLAKKIALAFVRYDYLTEGTELTVNGFSARVKDLPFID